MGHAKVERRCEPRQKERKRERKREILIPLLKLLLDNEQSSSARWKRAELAGLADGAGQCSNYTMIIHAAKASAKAAK